MQLTFSFGHVWCVSDNVDQEEKKRTWLDFSCWTCSILVAAALSVHREILSSTAQAENRGHFPFVHAYGITGQQEVCRLKFCIRFLVVARSVSAARVASSRVAYGVIYSIRLSRNLCNGIAKNQNKPKSRRCFRSKSCAECRQRDANPRYLGPYIVFS